MNYTLLVWFYWKNDPTYPNKKWNNSFFPIWTIAHRFHLLRKRRNQIKKKRNRIENIKIKTTDQCHMKEFLLFYMPANECDIHRMQIYTTWWVSVSLYNKRIDVGGQVCLKNKFSLIIRPKRNCLWYFCSWNINRNQDCVSFSLSFFFQIKDLFSFCIELQYIKRRKEFVLQNGLLKVLQINQN
jgi:hypothetical protein